jgi:hypothetical protein
MLVTSLEEMESIVNANPNLQWDGWNVVKYSVNANAMYSVDGVFKDGKWLKKKVFPITETGWHLPNNIGRKDAQVEG